MSKIDIPYICKKGDARMRVAVIGSRGLSVPNLEDYLPQDMTEILSGGAKGVDTSAREYAVSRGIKFTEYLPDYNRYGRRAPLIRNVTIIENADIVFAFWDGSSHGTRFVIEECRKRNIPVRIFIPKKPE
jgi:hypothetical protein